MDKKRFRRQMASAVGGGVLAVIANGLGLLPAEMSSGLRFLVVFGIGIVGGVIVTGFLDLRDRGRAARHNGEDYAGFDDPRWQDPRDQDL